VWAAAPALRYEVLQCVRGYDNLPSGDVTATRSVWVKWSAFLGPSHAVARQQAAIYPIEEADSPNRAKVPTTFIDG